MAPEEGSWEELFADAVPIEQDDGPVPVVRINYTPAFCKVMGYFRRVLVDNEHSSRALILSAGAHPHGLHRATKHARRERRPDRACF